MGDIESFGADPRRIEYAGSSVPGVTINWKAKYQRSIEDIKGNYAYFEVPYNGKDNDDYVNGEGFCCSQNTALRAGIGIGNVNYEKMQYYYHPDHLGSSSYITNLDGEIVQHVEYVPFGEVFIEERNNSWNTPYLFNGKELDEETGLYYYGARYYNPRESIFLSVDPMFEKTMTPYQYAYQNPIKFIDPTGMEGENTNEPPIKGIAYFSDDTGQYFWNHNKDSYEHYATGQDGYSYYEGMYTVDESKGPAGDYTIHLEGRKPGELAVKDIVEELYYTDVSREDVGRTITLEYSSRNLISSEVFAREKGEKNIKTLRATSIQPRNKADIVSGLSIKTKTYIETRAYGTSFDSSTNPTRNDAKTDMIKYGAEKLGEALKLGVKSLIMKR